jgi:hypothetical protein
MAKLPPPSRKGEPPAPLDTIGNLDKGEMSHLNFRVPKEFHKEFSIFAVVHDYKSQTEMLYEGFELLKEKYGKPPIA